MASGTVLQSTNNSTMTLRYSGTDGQAKVIEVPSTSGTMATESQLLGVGQTWQNVTASRVSGTTYTNNTGKPIQVSAYTGYGATGDMVLICSELIIDTDNQVAAEQTMKVSGIIPVGASYTVTKTGTLGISVWAELR